MFLYNINIKAASDIRIGNFMVAKLRRKGSHSASHRFDLSRGTAIVASVALFGAGIVAADIVSHNLNPLIEVHRTVVMRDVKDPPQIQQPGNDTNSTTITQGQTSSTVPSGLQQILSKAQHEVANVDSNMSTVKGDVTAASAQINKFPKAKDQLVSDFKISTAVTDGAVVGGAGLLSLQIWRVSRRLKRLESKEKKGLHLKTA